MKTISLIIALMSLITVAANNNNGDKPKSFSISGKVVDNSESLTGVKVILDNQEINVYTDFEGNFTLENILPGEHTLSLSMVTYDSKIITFNASQDNTLQIELESK